MASWREGISALVARLTTHDPERDPSARYQHQPHALGLRWDRQFAIRGPATLESSPGNNGDPVHARVVVEVFYKSEEDSTDLLQDVGADAEDLLQRIEYTCGSEWARTDGYDFLIDGPARIEPEAGAVRLRIPVRFIYNMRS